MKNDLENSKTILSKGYWIKESYYVGKIANIEYKTDEKLKNFFWNIEEQPIGSNIELEVSNDNKKVTFKPKIQGNYNLSINEADGFQTTSVKFSVNQKFSYDKNMVEYDNKNSSIGIVINQSRVSSNTLNIEETKSIISEYQHLTVLGYHKVYGVLVTYDYESRDALMDLERLKLHPQIKNVRNRTHIRKNIFGVSDISDPNDYGIGLSLVLI
ncbi:MAG: hypothetical protein OCD00_00760 [Colwellia sp.]